MSITIQPQSTFEADLYLFSLYYAGIGSNFPDSERTTPLKIAFIIFLML
jgi:hypothetical protein